MLIENRLAMGKSLRILELTIDNSTPLISITSDESCLEELILKIGLLPL